MLFEKLSNVAEVDGREERCPSVRGKQSFVCIVVVLPQTAPPLVSVLQSKLSTYQGYNVGRFAVQSTR